MAVFDCNNIKLQKDKSSGDKVKTLQEYLKKWGYYTRSVDGIFGKYTKAAVEQFQSNYKLTVDGWVGSETCKKINEVANTKEETEKANTLSFDCPNIKLKRNDSGENVKKLQTMLAELGYYQGRIDGEFGYYTEDSLMDFQRKTGHTPDGVFGPKTCPDLNKAYADKQAKTESEKAKNSIKENEIPITYKLTVLPDVVVLPETAYDETGTTKTVSGGSVETDTNFDCSKINLKRNDSGDDVKKLQTALKARGYYTRSIDGEFGKYTEQAVIKLQKAQGNSPDGWFGQKTCSKLQATSATSGNSDTKNKEYIITDFLGIPTTSTDVEGLTDEVTLNVVYTVDRMRHMRHTQKTIFEIYKGKELQRKHEGYISNLKITNEDDLPRIEISLSGYNVFLEQTIDIPEDKTGKRSELLKWLCDQANLRANIDLSGLDDSEFTLKAQKADTSSGASEGAGATMTIEEIYAEAAKWSYGGQGTGTCPKKAYDLYKKGCRTFDCYDATNVLCYMLHTFAKVKCRNLQTYSAYSDSRTHRVAQIYKNGEWICPEQAWNMTKKLRPFRPPESPGSVVIKYTLEVDDEISC